MKFHTLYIAALLAAPLTVHAQEPQVLTISDLLEEDITEAIDQAVDSVDFYSLLAIEAERLNYPLEIDRSIDVSDYKLPNIFYLPAVYKPYRVGLKDNIALTSVAPRPETPALHWVNSALDRHNRMEALQQAYFVEYPSTVLLNLNTLPKPPKKYVATVDPKSAKIKVEEIKIDLKEANSEVAPNEIKRKNWLHTFTGLVQFSQAYNSPNWYQGGNNNVNLIGNAVWGVKLNPAFNPNLLFENTVQYKLAVNSAPNDTLRNYSISEDRFQVNTKVGYKAHKYWYYSLAMQFKTQLFNNHPANSNAVTAALLAPGELNLGLGMTYNRVSPDKKTTIALSLDPLSYNLVMVRGNKVNRAKWGIKDGHHSVSQYGSNIEGKLTWKPAYNISYTSRLYVFTNYEYLQGDWEHTISFEINRFLSTQIYVHLRYDSQTPRLEDSDWHRWQLKEILSFGFAYKFSSL